MAINKKLIHFKKHSDFIGSKGINGTTSPTNGNYGQIPANSIVFILDTKQIWTHGQYYNCPYTQDEITALLNNKADISDLNNYLTTKAAESTYLTKTDASKTYLPKGNYITSIPVANGTTSGVVKSGGDVTISNGVITVKDDSHNHVISNIDGLQDALASKLNVITNNVTHIGDLVAEQVATFEGTTGTIKASGFTIGKSVPSDAVFTDTKSFTISAGATDDDVIVLTGTPGTNGVSYDAKHAKKFSTSNSTYTSGNNTTSISGSGGKGTIKIPQITVDSYGHVTAAADEDITITMPSVPTALKNPNALKFGTKSYDGSSELTITAADLGLSSALKYHGTTTTALTDGATTKPIVIGGSNHNQEQGCVVAYNNSSFVWDGSKWEELGNPGNYKVVQNAVSSPSTSGSATAFIDTISLDANGTITATKKNILTASTSVYGITKLSSATNSASEDIAATPKAVKSAYDLASSKWTYNTDTIKAIKVNAAGTADIANSVKWINVNNKPTNLSQFNDDVVAGNYLPLSGGTIEGQLNIKSSISVDDNIYATKLTLHPNDGWSDGENIRPWYGYHFIGTNNPLSTTFSSYYGMTFKTADCDLTMDTGGVAIKRPYSRYALDVEGIIAASQKMIINGNDVWHAGNDGEGSGLNADMLDGKQLHEIRNYAFGAYEARVIPEGTDIDALYGDDNYGLWVSLDNTPYLNAPYNNFSLLVVRVMQVYDCQILLPYETHYKLQYRSHIYSGGTIHWTEWKHIAFTDSDITGNAASATKATQDGNGKVIADTYAVKDEVLGYDDVGGSVEDAVEYLTTSEQNLSDAEKERVKTNIGVNVPIIDHGTNDSTFSLTPNKYHRWGTMSSLSISLAPASDNTVVSNYGFEFTSGATPTSFSYPSDVQFIHEIKIEANKRYQGIISNGMGVLVSVNKL